MEPTPPPQLTSPWRDCSSFSQGTTDFTPRTWRAKIGVFEIVLTRHRHCDPDAWVALCTGVYGQNVMKSKDVVEAADQALSIFKTVLSEALEQALTVDRTKAVLQGADVRIEGSTKTPEERTELEAGFQARVGS